MFNSVKSGLLLQKSEGGQIGIQPHFGRFTFRLIIVGGNPIATVRTSTDSHKTNEFMVKIHNFETEKL